MVTKSRGARVWKIAGAAAVVAVAILLTAWVKTKPEARPPNPVALVTIPVPLTEVQVKARYSFLRDPPAFASFDPDHAVRRQHRYRGELETCLNGSSRRDCRDFFATALAGAGAGAGAGFGRIASGDAAEASDPLPRQLPFARKASWVRSLERVADEGIPFRKIERGPDRELVIGISRKGVLGFSLQDKTSQP